MDDGEFFTLAVRAGMSREALDRCRAIQQACLAQGRRVSLLEAARAGRVLTAAQAELLESWSQGFAPEPARTPRIRRSSRHTRAAPIRSTRSPRSLTWAVAAGAGLLALGAAVVAGLSASGVAPAPRPAAPASPAQPSPPPQGPEPVTAREEPPVSKLEVDPGQVAAAPPEPELDQPAAKVRPGGATAAGERAAQLLRQAERQRGPERMEVLEEALELCERELPESAELGLTCMLLACEFVEQVGDLDLAMERCEQAIRLLEASCGVGDEDAVQSRVLRARIFARMGDDTAALRALEEELLLEERVLGVDHPLCGVLLGHQADTLRALGRMTEGRDTAARAVDILGRAGAPYRQEHFAASVTLANLLTECGQYEEARARLELSLQALDVRSDPSLAAELLHLLTSSSSLYRSMGLLVEARASLERALAMCERLGWRGGQAVWAQRQLGAVLIELGLVAEGRAHLLRAQRAAPVGEAEHLLCVVDLSKLRDATDAIAMLEAAGSEARAVPPVFLQELALRYLEAGQPARSRAIWAALVKGLETTVGPDSPRFAEALSLACASIMELKDFAAARRLLTDALAVQERIFPREHPALLATRSAWARLLLHEGKPADAKAVLLDVVVATESALLHQMSILSPRERLAALVRQRRVLSDWLAFCAAAGEPGYEGVMRLKGLIGRRDEAEARALRREGPEVRALVGQLQECQRALSRVLYAGAQATGAAGAQVRDSLARLNKRCEELDREIVRRSQGYAARDRRLRLGPADVQAQLREGEALVDVVRDPERYVAFVLARRGAPVRIELGDTSSIEAAVGLFREALLETDGASAGSLHSAGRSLRALVWDPLATALDGASVVYVVPDGALGALPFAALPAREPGKHLADEVCVAHLGAAQDLVPWTGEQAAASGALGFGGIDYDHASAAAGTPAGPPLPATFPGGMRFPPLAATGIEVQACLEHFGAATGESTRLLSGSEATESALRLAVRGRRVVHLATHGFVRLDLPSALDGAKGARAGGFDPMLLSGLALAGANSGRGGGADDGILTALEASQLQLEGVELVVLSACETANGSATAGEGIVGLVRGFRQAGARTVLASLWPVSDLATAMLMEQLYARAYRRAARPPMAAALRESALALRGLEVKGDDGRPARPFAHPRFWAAFVAYGPQR